jgi:hypothetical protein
MRVQVRYQVTKMSIPLSDAEKERIRRGRVASGVTTDEEDIDEILYGRVTRH